MRIEVMLIAKESTADTTSVSTMIDFDTQKPGWESGLVETVTTRASAGAEQLRHHLLTDDRPDTFVPVVPSRPATGFVPLSQLLPSA